MLTADEEVVENEGVTVEVPDVGDGQDDDGQDSVTEVKEAATEPTSAFRKTLKLAIKSAFVLFWICYSIAAFAINWTRALPIFYYNLVIVICLVLYYGAKYFESPINNALEKINNVSKMVEESRMYTAFAILFCLVIFAIIIGVSVDDANRLIAILGLLVFIGVTWLTSWKPRDVKLRPVMGGLLFQFIFGALILRTDPFFWLFDLFGSNIAALLDYSKVGAQFVYAYTSQFLGLVPLIDGENNIVGSFFAGPTFAFGILPSVIFFGSLVSVLYHVGILQVIIRVIGRFLAFLLGTSASESLNAAGNIFVGQTEAPLLIKPFLKEMTESELHAVMTGGFATIAGGVLAIYISFGVSATHLIGASVMSAPAALAMSKIAYPETEESKTRAGVAYVIHATKYSNFIEAAAAGAGEAMYLVINICAQLIAFLSLLAMVDAWLGYFGAFVDIGTAPGSAPLSFKLISGYVFYPFAFLMGVDVDDCLQVGSLLGVKIFTNEFVAYEQLAGLIAEGSITKQSEIIATYALCGFSNFGSLGIQLGGLTPLAPNQGPKLAKLVLSAMIVGNTACFMTACVAGLLYDVNRS